MRDSSWTLVGLTLVIFGAGLTGCGPSGRDDNPTNPGVDGGPTGDGGPFVDTCSDDAKLVYVVDSNNKLSTFNPQSRTFTDLGTLNCPAEFLATPFSMSIDRTPSAWVLYSSGELFKVDTTTLACTATSWSTQQGLALYGMGFSTDQPGGSTDTLFIAGGVEVSTTSSTFARLDLGSMQASVVGQVQGSPELTGTGSAELWGFFPNASGARIEQINKANGGAGTTFSLTALAGEPLAWAFAFWGGDFWVFLMKNSETSTTVYQIDGTTGAVKGSTPASGRTIVGAGVSTCAPTVIL